MSGLRETLEPLAFSTPIRQVDLDASHMSVRSARKRQLDTGTEVVVAVPRNLPDPPTSNTSNSNNANSSNDNNNAPRAPQRKRHVKFARLVAAEIRYLQKTTHPLIRRACFARVVRSIGQEKESRALNLRWQASALDCLQEATEAFLVDFFSFAARAAAHAKRVTVMVRDFNFIMQFYNKNLSL
nr:centromere specific histone H3 CENP A [Hymenolepis microstoma]